MSINAITSGLPSIESIAPLQPAQPAQGTAPSGFGQMLSDALKEVDGMQKEANNQIEGLALSKSGITPHSAMIALEKADVAFQLMTQIKSKIIQAYQEVLRTQV